MSSVALISVVDDDESVRESLEGLLKAAVSKSVRFSAAEEFLTSPEITETDCLILDVRLGRMSGPELQRELIAGRFSAPIVFITAHGDAMMRTRVMADGAIDCLLKPFTEEELLAASVSRYDRASPNGHRQLNT